MTIAERRSVEMLASEQLVQIAQALAPVFRERAEADSDARRVPDESIADLKQAGLFRVIQARCNGGHEIDMVTHLDVTSGDCEYEFVLARV